MPTPKRHDTTVTLDATVTYNYYPGSPEYIPPYSKPEDYDPGSDPEVDIVSVKAGTADVTARLDDAELNAVINEIIEAEGGRPS